MLKIIPDDAFDREVTDHPGSVIVEFFSNDCKPCKVLEKTLLSLEPHVLAKYNIVKIDIEQSDAVVQKLRIQSVPTLILFEHGEEINRLVGSGPKSMLLKFLAGKDCD